MNESGYPIPHDALLAAVADDLYVIDTDVPEVLAAFHAMEQTFWSMYPSDSRREPSKPDLVYGFTSSGLLVGVQSMALNVGRLRGADVFVGALILESHRRHGRMRRAWPVLYGRHPDAWTTRLNEPMQLLLQKLDDSLLPENLQRAADGSLEFRQVICADGALRDADPQDDAVVIPAAELGAAWAAVHANTPDGWYVGQPGYEERYRQWSMFAFDPSEKAVDGGRERQWTAVGRTELECVKEMARCLGELKDGRWPK